MWPNNHIIVNFHCIMCILIVCLINQSMILFVNVGHRPIIQNYIHDQYKTTKELQLHYDVYSVERRRKLLTQTSLRSPRRLTWIKTFPLNQYAACPWIRLNHDSINCSGSVNM